jgi:hypothetical protein
VRVDALGVELALEGSLERLELGLLHLERRQELSPALRLPQLASQPGESLAGRLELRARSGEALVGLTGLRVEDAVNGHAGVLLEADQGADGGPQHNRKQHGRHPRCRTAHEKQEGECG